MTRANLVEDDQADAGKGEKGKTRETKRGSPRFAQSMHAEVSWFGNRDRVPFMQGIC